ncbi:MAG: acyltransferase [Marinosulfonomonas sp.]|nr:acyltransferase [Marinosulfonomonas sp.]
MQYRREIDGLRAVAVIPVILFHAGFTIFSGGYVGVDVFFVISGYLITTIILNELEQGKFSILRFYERRARRILPTLFFVMLCCIPCAWMWMLPSQFEDFSQSLVAVTIFASNILFWRESGYFDAASEEKPLLHTWSLAVEEQYYLFFPILLILLWRFGRNPVLYSIVAISVFSLLLSEWGWRNSSTANFYLIPTRAWELLAGSICAFLQLGKATKSNNALSAFGLALIVFSIFIYDDSTPFPSLYALAPVVGTALIILYGARETWVARLLSLKAFVGIGLISYSAYLWHQPLFAFARIRSLNVPEQWLMLVLAIASLALAYLSWRFVEQPFRNGKTKYSFTRKQIFSLFGTIGIVFIFLGTFALGQVPTLIEINHPNLEFKPVSVDEVAERKRCVGFEKIGVNAKCEIIGEGSKLVVVWGDSHAGNLKRSIGVHPDYSFLVISHNGCPPVTSVVRIDQPLSDLSCTDIQTLGLYADFITSLKPSTVVLMARWTMYQNGQQSQGRLNDEHHFLTDGPKGRTSAEYSAALLEQNLHKTVDLLGKHSKIIIASQAPDLNFLDERSRILLSEYPRQTSDLWHTKETLMMNGLEKRGDVRILNSKSEFCSSEVCFLRLNGHLLYIDDNHLSQLGAGMIWDKLLNMF